MHAVSVTAILESISHITIKLYLNVFFLYSLGVREKETIAS